MLLHAKMNPEKMQKIKMEVDPEEISVHSIKVEVIDLGVELIDGKIKTETEEDVENIPIKSDIKMEIASEESEDDIEVIFDNTNKELTQEVNVKIEPVEIVPKIYAEKEEDVLRTGIKIEPEDTEIFEENFDLNSLKKEYENPPVIIKEEIDLGCATTVKIEVEEDEIVEGTKAKAIEPKYICSKCNSCFWFRFQLNVHMKAHPRAVRYLKCQLCGVSFRSRISLEKHSLVHTAEKAMAKAQANEKEIKRPETVIDNKIKQLITAKENKIKRMNKERENVNRERPPLDKPFPCQCCDKKFVRRSELNKHIIFHSESKPFQCITCSKRYKREYDLIKHEKTHESTKPCICQFCHRYFAALDLLLKHEKKHKTKEIFCMSCGKSFIQEVKLRKHELIHKSDKLYFCEHCDIGFKTKRELKKNILIHFGVKAYKCETCDKAFFFAHELKSHKHELFECEHCDESFFTKNERKFHKKIHIKPIKVHCLTCGKTFTNLRHLKAHERTHSEDRPFSCKICGKRFKFNYELTKHGVVHTEKTPVNCETCGKSFKSPIYLQRHMRRIKKS